MNSIQPPCGAELRGHGKTTKFHRVAQRRHQGLRRILVLQGHEVFYEHVYGCMDVYVYMCASVHSMPVQRIRNAQKSVLKRANGVQRVRGVKQIPALTRKSSHTCVYFVLQLVGCVPVCTCMYVYLCAMCTFVHVRCAEGSLRKCVDELRRCVTAVLLLVCESVRADGRAGPMPSGAATLECTKKAFLNHAIAVRRPRESEAPKKKEICRSTSA